MIEAVSDRELFAGEVLRLRKELRKLSKAMRAGQPACLVRDQWEAARLDIMLPLAGTLGRVITAENHRQPQLPAWAARL
jgi:hypothetical protein